MPPKSRPEYFVIDVDGVMTTGQFLYSEDGKAYKVFGPHDSDGLKLVEALVTVHFITADARGYQISKRRIVDDMNYPLSLVSEAERADYFEQNFSYEKTVFMGDGYHDAPVLERAMCGIAPSNARPEAMQAADFITPSAGGSGAVMDACLYLLEKYFSE